MIFKNANYKIQTFYYLVLFTNDRVTQYLNAYYKIINLLLKNIFFIDTLRPGRLIQTSFHSCETPSFVFLFILIILYKILENLVLM